jgi:Tol biopolymer transport system component
MMETLEARSLLSTAGKTPPAISIKPALAATEVPPSKLPWNITRIASGQRAAWSPDGQKIAFVDKEFGNAFEYDVKTKTTRELTGGFSNAGILRVQYLPNGDYLIVAPAVFKDATTSRWNEAELWVLKKNDPSQMFRLGQRVSEGVAISRLTNKIAWATDFRQYPGTMPTMYDADIVYDNAGVPHLANKTLLFTQPGTMEAQDFRDHDRELIFPDYSHGTGGAAIRSYRIDTKKFITYRTSKTEYNEPEGIFPNGNYELVESSRDRVAQKPLGQYIDLWKVELKPGSRIFTRLTRFGDYGPYKASNGVISPNGRYMAFQSSIVGAEAGTGQGVYLMDLAPTAKSKVFSDSFAGIAGKSPSWQITNSTSHPGSAKLDGNGHLVMASNGSGAAKVAITRTISTKGFSNIAIQLTAEQANAAYAGSDYLKIEVDAGDGFERILTDAERFDAIDNATPDNTSGNDGNTSFKSTGYLALNHASDNGSIRLRITVSSASSAEKYLLDGINVSGTPMNF